MFGEKETKVGGINVAGIDACHWQQTRNVEICFDGLEEATSQLGKVVLNDLRGRAGVAQANVARDKINDAGVDGKDASVRGAKQLQNDEDPLRQDCWLTLRESRSMRSRAFLQNESRGCMCAMRTGAW